MPWEVERNGGQWLLTKAGNIDQFSTYMAHDPTARFAVWINTNKPQSVTELGPQISTILAEAFRGALIGSEACPTGLPSQPEQFTGRFTAYVPSLVANMTITVQVQSPAGCKSSGLSALFDWGSGALPAALMPQSNKYGFTIEIPPSLPITCIFATELAWSGHTMAFDHDVQAIQLPGLLTGVTFPRDK
jgi:hypothetical protein